MRTAKEIAAAIAQIVEDPAAQQTFAVLSSGVISDPKAWDLLGKAMDAHVYEKKFVTPWKIQAAKIYIGTEKELS
jgi:hypothetical protein